MSELSKDEIWQLDEIQRCEVDWWYFLTTYWKTMDKDTGKVKLFATFDGKYDKPEYREFIHWLLGEVDKRVKARREIEHPDIAEEKFRQAYATNAFMAQGGYYTLFHPNFRGLVTHEKEEKADKKGDFNTPFGMIDFGINHLPDFLRPAKNDLVRSHLEIGLESINSKITGDAGIRPGAGGGFDWIYNTEFAHQKNTSAKLAAEIEAAKGPIILDSTPNGKFNAHAITCDFAEKHPDESSYLFVPIDWFQRRTPEWLPIKVKSYNGDDALLAQEVYRSREGSVQGRAFKHFNPECLVTLDPLTFKPFLSVNGFDPGWTHSTAAVFIAPLAEDKWVVYADYMDKEKPPPVHAEKMWEITRRWGATNTHWIADPATKQKSQQTGKKFIEIYAGQDITQPIPIENRIQFEDGDNAIKEGISAVNSMFYNGKLFVSRDCHWIIDALNEAKYSLNKNNVPTNEKYEEAWYTDICDALRYAVSKLAKYLSLAQSRQVKMLSRPVKRGGIGLGAYGRR